MRLELSHEYLTQEHVLEAIYKRAIGVNGYTVTQSDGVKVAPITFLPDAERYGEDLKQTIILEVFEYLQKQRTKKTFFGTVTKSGRKLSAAIVARCHIARHCAKTYIKRRRRSLNAQIQNYSFEQAVENKSKAAELADIVQEAELKGVEIEHYLRNCYPAQWRAYKGMLYGLTTREMESQGICGRNTPTQLKKNIVRFLYES